MIARNRNELWGRVLLDELARAGVRHLIVSPGSRSAPIVLGAAADGRFRIHVQIDERSAGFFALGVGKATGVPAAVITTSGTAVANLFPAVVESFQSECALILLTADRPARLQGADANQTIDQHRIFGPYTRFFEELSPAEASEASLRHLRSVACRAVAAAIGDPGGPAHLNLPFDKPLEPVLVEGDLPEALARGTSAAARGRSDEAPWTRTVPRRAGSAGEGSGLLVTALERARRPLFLAGPLPRPWAVGPALRRAAGAWGVPLLADSLSGARFPVRGGALRGGGTSGGEAEWVDGSEKQGTAAPLIGGYDLALRSPAVREALRPDLLIRVGGAPTSAVLGEWCVELEDIPSFVVDGGGRWKDHSATASTMIVSDPATFLGALAEAAAPPGPEVRAWSRAWMRLETAVRGELTTVLGGGAGTVGLFEGVIAAEVAGRIGSGAFLFTSSSMPVRDVDTFVPDHGESLLVLGNRGASGIDGIVSTAAGASLATGRRVVVLLGDLALLHDGNGLASLREPGVNVVLVVVNNDGGGIFHLLPVRDQEPAFTPYFAAPHGRDFARLAAFHDLPYEFVEGRGETSRLEGLGAEGQEGSSDGARGGGGGPRGMDGVRGALDRVLAEERSAILEIRTDREENRRLRSAAVERIAAAAEDALNQVER